jgi:hypothetical protein
MVITALGHSRQLGLTLERHGDNAIIWYFIRRELPTLHKTYRNPIGFWEFNCVFGPFNNRDRSS